MGRPKREKPATTTIATKLSKEEAAGLGLLLDVRAHEVRRLTGQKKPTASGLIRLLIVEALTRDRERILRRRDQRADEMTEAEREARLAVLQPIVDSGRASEDEYREWFFVMFGTVNPFR